MQENTLKLHPILLVIAAVFLLFLYLTLYPRLTIHAGEWQEVPGLKAPIPTAENFNVVRMREGRGREVQQGDLIKISLHVLNGCREAGVIGVRCYDRHDAWIYAGGAPGEKEMPANGELKFFMGTLAFRNALPGLKVGDRLLMHGFRFRTFIPTKGLILLRDEGFHPTFYYPDWIKNYSKNEGHIPLIALDSNATLDVEVLQSCPARLLAKWGTYHQTGYKPGTIGWGGTASRAPTFQRSGRMQWGAIEASCEGSEKPVRIEASPDEFQSVLSDSGSPYAQQIPLSDDVYVGIDRNNQRVRPKNEQDRLSAPSEFAAPFLWSIENAVADENDCKAASPNFSEACKEYVRLNPATSIAVEKLGAPEPGMPRILDDVKLLGTTPSKEGLRALQFSPDGKNLLSSTSSSADLWKVATGRKKQLYQNKNGYGYVVQGNVVAFAPDGKKLAVAGWDSVDLWDLSEASQAKPLPVKEIGWLKFSADGKTLTGVAQDYSVWQWPVASESISQPIPIDSQRPREPGKMFLSRVAALSKDQKLLAIASHDNVVQVWSLRLKKRLHTLTFATDIRSLDFLPNAQSLLIAGPGVHLLNISTGELKPLISERDGSGFGAAFLLDGKFFVVRSGSGQIFIRDTKSLRELAKLELPNETQPKRSYSKFSIAPDGKSIATGEGWPDTGNIRIWTLTSALEGK